MTQALRLKGSASIGGTRIFHAIDLNVTSGRWTCLLGTSGVGKSTVLRLAAGLSDGIDFHGEIVRSGRVALMAQDDLLLPWLSVLDNVLIGARLRGESPDRPKARHALAQVGLDDHAKKKPGALSGGQRQRVALARTLMEDRSIVLLDEPFSALDALTRARMQDLTAEVLRDRTVVVVTHDTAEAARLGHNILIMRADGLTNVVVPDGEIPRPVDAHGVLESQASLLNQLRGTI